MGLVHKVKCGKHVFRVEATNSAGKQEPLRASASGSSRAVTAEPGVRQSTSSEASEG